jgi:hypothetical protein
VTRPIQRLTAVALAAALVVIFAGCGSSKKSGGPSPTTTSVSASKWDAASTAALVRTVKTIARRLPGQCTDAGLLPRDQYLFGAEKIGLDPPLAVADCTAFGQQAELNVFASAAVRDAWNRERTDILCRRSRDARVPINGLHFVVAKNMSIQAPSEFSGQRLAPAVHGTYLALACPGVATVDWEPAAEARVNQLVAKLRARPNLKCGNFQLLDRDTYSRNAGYANRLPAAYARCEGPGVVIWIAVFSKTSASPAAFISGETNLLCGSQGGVVAVRGSDWAIIVADAHVAAIVAAALGGTAAAPAC